jgi:hypothetical protein
MTPTAACDGTDCLHETISRRLSMLSGTECAKLGGAASAATLTPCPFRQPREMPARMLALPSYANAFEYAFNVVG